ncbi:hypothetical protein ACE6H2_026263 [Prunus campanulata]
MTANHATIVEARIMQTLLELPQKLPELKRREKRRKLILPPNEVEENQVVPPAQEAVVTADHAAIVEAGTMQTLPEVNKTVAAPETPRVRDERKEAKAYLVSRLSGGKPSHSSNSEPVVTADPAAIMEARITQTLLKNLDMLIRMRTLLQRTSEIKPFLASTSRFLMQWLDKILGNALKLREVPNEGVDHPDLVKTYQARRAKRMDLLSEAETSVKELQMIELREQRLRAQIEVGEYDHTQLCWSCKKSRRKSVQVRWSSMR